MFIATISISHNKVVATELRDVISFLQTKIEVINNYKTSRFTRTEISVVKALWKTTNYFENLGVKLFGIM